ncbi:MAG TPA: radical SAM protein [Bryobacteraceae bacterium]|nr:radical SAM protein [Bryobacteraceae bacterium]
MRVVFLEVDTESEWAMASLGPAFLAAYLRRHGHEALMVRAPITMPDGDVVEMVRGTGAELLGVSMTTRQWLRARHLVGLIRQEIDVPVVAGGLHATFSPEAVLAAPGFDFACMGEGEEALLDLVETLAAGKSAHGLGNIWVRGGFRPVLRKPVEHLDQLPFAARDLLAEPHGVVQLSTQRGCPFPCTYCGARMFNELYEGTAEYGRRRSHENVLAELRELREAGKLSFVIFLDDTFTIHHPWVKEFCRLYKQEFRTPFCLHARVETVNEKMVHMLADAGCQQITYGVESGSERVRREIMHRPVTNQRFREVFRWTNEAGIRVIANYMLGLPGETRAELEETYALAEELPSFDFGFFVFYPYPGTHLFQTCREKGYLPPDYLTRPANHRTSILTLPTLEQKDIDEVYDKFTDLRVRRERARWGGVPVVDHAYVVAKNG